MISDYRGLYIKAAKCGSRITCNPAPTNTDEDWIILIKESKWEDARDCLLDDGWVLGGSDISSEMNNLTQDEQFRSFTKEIDGTLVNFICTKSEVFYDRFWAATTVCKRLNLMDKADRIALFQAVLYANPNEDIFF